MLEDAREGEARDVAGFLKARDFFFLEGCEDGAFVEQRGGRIAAELGEAEDAHQ